MESKSRTIRYRTDVGSAYITLADSCSPPRVFISIGKPGSSLRAMAASIEFLVNRLLEKGDSPEEIGEILSELKTSSHSSGIMSLPQAVSEALKSINNNQGQLR